jgi:hypothetical protein
MTLTKLDLSWIYINNDEFATLAKLVNESNVTKFTIGFNGHWSTDPVKAFVGSLDSNTLIHLKLILGDWNKNMLQEIVTVKSNTKLRTLELVLDHDCSEKDNGLELFDELKHLEVIIKIKQRFNTII